MKLAQRFEDLEIWWDARRLVREVYGAFAMVRDASFRDQIQRASLSVMNNIAEGFERRTRKDFMYFLNLAKSSCGEVRSMLYAAADLGYIAAGKGTELREAAEILSRRIAALSRSLRS